MGGLVWLLTAFSNRFLPVVADRDPFFLFVEIVTLPGPEFEVAEA
jgi:hypothetical protein